MQPNIRTDYVKSIHLSDLELNDSIYDPGSVLVDREKIFNFQTEPTRFLPYKNKFHNAVTYELSDTNHVYYRSVYTFLDWLRDIGGLYGSISAFCIAIVFIVQFQGQNMYLMAKLYAANTELPQQGGCFGCRSAKTNEISPSSGKSLQDQHKLRWHLGQVFMTNLKRFCKDHTKVQKYCCCLRSTQRDQVFINGYEKLTEEIRITNVLKQIRVMEGVLKDKLGKENWNKAVKKYRLRDPMAKDEKDHDEISTNIAKPRGIIALDLSPQMNDTEN